MIRPQPARWFECACARDDAFVLLEALAASRSAEIEWHGSAQEKDARAANLNLKEYAALARGYRVYWPAPALRPSAQCPPPLAAFETALARLRTWAAEATPLIATLQARESALAELAAVERVVDVLDGGDVDLAQLASARAGVQARVFVQHAEPGAASSLPDGAAARGDRLVRRFAARGEAYALVVASTAEIERLEREAPTMQARVVALPPWLGRDAHATRALILERRAAATREIAATREALDASLARCEVALALGDIARAAWCFENAGAIATGEVLARINGWTDDPAGLAAAGEASGARAIATFPAAPAGARAPVLLRNPWWARPFEIFARLFGVPSGEGVDPSMLLAIASPLLFGYMFGDVGHGLMLLAAGLALRRRHPALALLVPGGLASIGFGVLFGSVFAYEGLIHPLWTAPLADPLRILLVPLVAGAALLATGLALQGLEAWWRGAFLEWLRCDAGLAFVYGGILGAMVHPAGAAVALAGATAFVAGRASREAGAAAALAALAQLAEKTLQLLVNTISFARVGAFALGHAGLSAAVVALAEATGNRAGYLVALVAGNLLIIVLEGLVVAIQTTRLVLFEFFVRFFDTRGREFRPLLPPTALEDRP